MISHANLASNGLALKEFWEFSKADVLLHMLPVFHVHGLFFSSHCVLLSGAKMYFIEKFDPETAIKYFPLSTVFMGVPTYYTRLLDRPLLDQTICKNIRLFISGSAPLLEKTFTEFKVRTCHTLLERYGMTETGINTSNPINGERLAGAVGLPLPNNKIRIVDENNLPLSEGEVGHIQVKGNHVFKGYWRMPEKTLEEFTQDGFFNTGDMGKLDQLGYLHIVGRSKDLIISGGLNVYPKAVELCINEIEGVLESAVIGLPDEDFGEMVAAAVVKEVNSVLTEVDIISYVKNHLASFKVPKKVLFIDEIPKNTMGKVQKNLLRVGFRA